MRLLARLFCTLIFCIPLIFITRIAYAEGEFQIDYKVIYSVDINGKTTVSQDINLKNKTSNYYADKFELKIGSTKVANVDAKDATGPLKTDVKFEDNVTTISVKFNQRVIGVDKTLPWTLTYTSDELATKSGQIWEISIPRLAKSTEIGAYEAILRVPRNFGAVAFAVPQPKNQSQTAQIQEFSFDKDQLIESGIAMSFGKKQVFSFDLNYYLENNNLTSQIMSVTLPPDNNYQKIDLEKLEPKPLDVTVDRDGNFLAKYRLSPKENLNIKAQGFVEVFSVPFRKIVIGLSNEDKNLYTQPQKYWEIDNAQIKDKARELKTPRTIYDFVAKNLTYNKDKLNKSKVERLGALGALNSPKDAVCMEFTDLFIALSRSAGIPAREVEGYAYTQNERLRPLSLTLSEGDVLHAWPEYWDDNLGWVQVDPTWGSTSGGIDYFEKLDFNHITFIQRGISSTTPYPAGSFKKEGDENKKDVSVTFAQELPSPITAPGLTLIAPEKIIAGIPVKVEAQLNNIGSTSIIDRELTLSSSTLKVVSSNSLVVDILPPFSRRTYSFNLQSDNILRNSRDTLVLSFDQTQFAKPVEIIPIYKIVFTSSFLLTTVVVFLVISLGLFLYHKINSKSRPKPSSTY